MGTVKEILTPQHDSIVAEIYEVDPETEVQPADFEVRPAEVPLGSDFQVVATELPPNTPVNIVVEHGGVIIGRVMLSGDDGDASFSTTALIVGEGSAVVREIGGEVLFTASFTVVPAEEEEKLPEPPEE